MAASATEGGTTSLASSPPLWGRRQTRTSVPRNSNPAAVLADCTAAWASASKSRLACANAPPAASAANTAKLTEMPAACFMMPPWFIARSVTYNRVHRQTAGFLMNRAIEQDEPAERELEDGLSFAQRMHRMRMLGTALGAVCVGGSLWVQNAHWLAWTAVALNALAWPHVALALARRSSNPYRAELRNLTFDSASGGAWIAAIGFSPAPSTVMFAMLAMGMAAIGGLRLLARCLAAQLAAAAVVLTALGFELHLQPSSGIERL